MNFFELYFEEKFFFQKPLKTRFSVENVDLRGYQKKRIKFFLRKKSQKMRFLIKPRRGKYYELLQMW